MIIIIISLFYFGNMQCKDIVYIFATKHAKRIFAYLGGNSQYFWGLVKFIMCTLVFRLHRTFYILIKGYTVTEKQGTHDKPIKVKTFESFIGTDFFSESALYSVLLQVRTEWKACHIDQNCCQIQAK